MQDVVFGWDLAMKFSVRFGWNLNFNSIWLIINYLRLDVWDSYGTVGFANKLSLLHHRQQHVSKLLNMLFSYYNYF